MWQRQKLGLLVVLFLLAWPLGIVPCNAQAPDSPKTDPIPENSWDRSHSYHPLSRLTLALRDFDDEYGHLPQRAIRSDEGERLLSWRVALLPFIGQQELHQKFHLDEPWDSDHNRKLLPLMPDIFTIGLIEASAPAVSKGKTRVVLPLIEGSLWYGDDGRLPRIKDVTDGTANTIGLLIAPPGADVIWTKPEDFSMNKPHEMFGDRDFCLLTTLDGGLWRIADSTAEEVLNALLTFDVGDTVDRKRIIRKNVDETQIR